MESKPVRRNSSPPDENWGVHQFGGSLLVSSAIKCQYVTSTGSEKGIGEILRQTYSRGEIIHLAKSPTGLC